MVRAAISMVWAMAAEWSDSHLKNS
jgi:hypothetical protein